MKEQTKGAQTEDRKKPEVPVIDIYKAWCKSCGICVAFCPTGVLARDELGSPFVKDISKCINCGWCEIRCPDFAITVQAKKRGPKKDGDESKEESTEGETSPG